MFPKHKLTVRNLVTCCNTDIITLSSEGQFDSIFFDLSGSGFFSGSKFLAFIKLTNYAFYVNYFNWFCDYRTSRACYVRFSGVAYFISMCGVSQVSVLGPLLFNMYVNDT